MSDLAHASDLDLKFIDSVYKLNDERFKAYLLPQLVFCVLVAIASTLFEPGDSSFLLLPLLMVAFLLLHEAIQ